MFDIVLAIATATFQFSDSSLRSSVVAQTLIQTELMAQNSPKSPFNLRINLLEAYEATIPPPGAPSNYPVGHAVVRLRVENLTQNNSNFDIRKIELRRVDNNIVLLSQAMKPLNLGGLQILERGFHLTNCQGFRDAKKVKAVVSYQFNGKSFTVESSIAEVMGR